MSVAESEIAVVGGLKHHPEHYDRLGGCLAPESFASAKCGELFRALSAIIEDGQEPTDDRILAELQRAGSRLTIADVVAIPYAPGANIAYYAGQVREGYRRRRLRALAAELGEAVKSRSADELIEHIERTITELAETGAREIVEIQDRLGEFIEQVEAYIANRGKPDGIMTGYPDLDFVLGGLRRGELTVIGARPSIGKTALALSMAVNMAEQGIVVGLFSCEMSREQITERMVSGDSRVNLTNIRNGTLREADLARIVESCNRIRGTRILIDDTPSPTLAAVCGKARAMRRRGAQILFVDYLTLLRHGDARMSRPERVGEISKRLKALARELDMPIVALSQLNRDAENASPNLSNIRQSGEIEEDADVIMLMHRERGNEAAVTTIDVAKARNSMTDKVELMFLPHIVRFESKSRGGEEWEA
jgi:replicative DNA helicase